MSSFNRNDLHVIAVTIAEHVNSVREARSAGDLRAHGAQILAWLKDMVDISRQKPKFQEDELLECLRVCEGVMGAFLARMMTSVWKTDIQEAARATIKHVSVTHEYFLGKLKEFRAK